MATRASISFSLLFLFHFCAALPRKLIQVQTPSTVLNYHNDPLLKGNYTLHLLFYGAFCPRNARHRFHPLYLLWWHHHIGVVVHYIKIHGWLHPHHPCRQLLDSSYTLSKRPTLSQLISHKALNYTDAPVGPTTQTITAVLTSFYVVVPGLCSSRCGSHGVKSVVYVWVGNSATQCPGQCACPFHQPIYGSQTPPLVAPNSDIGVEGMIINLATVLVGAVTNPFGDEFYQGPADAPLEAVSACTGMFGSRSYLGYPGQVVVDPTTGASYNAEGLNGRKYLLPAIWNLKTSQCTLLT